MRTHVDFKFSKSYATYKKDDIKSFYKPMARELQDKLKVGKIIGQTLTKHEIANMEAKDAKLITLESDLVKVKKELATSVKALKVANNKLDKLALQRATK